MDTRAQAATGPRLYEDFEPVFEWIGDGGEESVLVHVPGFQKEQLKVVLTGSGKLRISGARPLEGNRWSRFQKEFEIPDKRNTKGIRAKFEEGLLYVIFPKLVSQAQEPSPAPQTTTAEPKPSDQKDAGDKAQPAISDKPQASAERQAYEKMREKEKDPAGEPMDKEERRGDELNGAKQVEPPSPKHVTAGVVGGARAWLEELKYGKGRAVLSLNKPIQLALIVTMVVLFLAVLGMYVTYKLKRPTEDDGSKGVL